MLQVLRLLMENHQTSAQEHMAKRQKVLNLECKDSKHPDVQEFQKTLSKPYGIKLYNSGMYVCIYVHIQLGVFGD